ncbi:hypothetical protein [Actinacidiphila alni]|nr:hypothetical protein [Actinacidiphila alni]
MSACPGHEAVPAVNFLALDGQVLTLAQLDHHAVAGPRSAW